MFIEVTELEYNKKHLLNITYIVDVIDNNKDQWFPCTSIIYKDTTLNVKETYKHVKNAIANIITQLSKGK